nr:MAG TPA: hypothetical protein [Caudoviricetes sp.]
MLACAQITIRDAMDELYASAIAPEDPAMDQLWLDTSASPSVLKRWTGTAWETVNDTAPLVERILRAEQRVTDEAILATVTESEAYQGLETRLSSAEQQITSDAILATVRSSAEYRSDVYGERNFVLLSHLHATFIDNRYVNASGTATQYAQIGFTLSEDLYAASGQGKNLYISFDIKRTNVVATANNIYSGVWINYSYWGENWDTVTSNWGWYLRDTDSDFQATDNDWVHIKKGPMDLDKRNALSLIYLVFGGEAADGTTGKIELRNPKVEVAGFSDWTRAPEDLADMPERLSSAESKIEQHSDEISLKVSQTTYDSEKIYRSATAPANPTMGMLWLDTGATPNLLKRCTLADADGWVMWDIVGAREVSASGVYIGPDTVRIDTPNFTVTVPGAGEQLQIDGEGVVAQTITSPSIVQQYTGSSTAYVRTDAAPDGKQYFRSLEDIFSVVRGKYVSQLTVYLMSSGTLSIGDLVVQQIHGRIRIYNMANMILAGSLSFTRCDSVELSGIVLHSSHSIGISVSDCYAFECADGKIYGPGAGIGINLGRHINASIMNTEIRGYSSAVSANYSCVLFTKNLSGTGAISALGCCLMANGTVPSGGVRAMENALVSSSGSSASGGSGTTPVIPALQTARYNATVTRTYRNNRWESESGLRQGYTAGNGQHYACIWFDNATLRANLSGKTIASATLTVRRIAGYGRGGAVNVYLHGLTNASASGTPSLSGNYGLLGAMEPTNVLTFTLPVGIVTALRSGSIQGFCLYTGETSTISGEVYSRHYAAFTNAEGVNMPYLSVTYQ